MESKHRNQPPPCGTCNGSGKVYRTSYNPETKKTETRLVTCDACGGTGK